MAFIATRDEDGSVKFVQNDPFYVNFDNLTQPAKQFAQEAHDLRIQRRIYEAFLTSKDLSAEFEGFKQAYVQQAYNKMIADREEQKRKNEELRRLEIERERERFVKIFYSN
jgi:hypothetical protein